MRFRAYVLITFLHNPKITNNYYNHQRVNSKKMSYEHGELASEAHKVEEVLKEFISTVF